MTKIEIKTYYPKSKRHWRKWLEENHMLTDAVWLILYKKKSNKPTLSWTDAVDEALCFGWIDSIRKPLDEESSIQFFSKRKSKSTWSKINKEKVQKLINEGLMTAAGFESIKTAKHNGSWVILDDVEALIIPKDLEAALNTKAHAMDFFLSLSKSVRKAMLQWIVFAKRPETRQKRIMEIAELADIKKKPKQF